MEPGRAGSRGVPGAWVGDRLGGQFGAVTRFVPRGYPAYARIFHPALDARGTRATWSEVGRGTGRETHPLMQWHALVGADLVTGAGSRWTGTRPRLGVLDPDLLEILCARLANHTAATEECHIGVWDGWGDLNREPFDAREIVLPDRTYLHLAAPLSRVPTLERSPNLLWPVDREWFVASEIDLDSTLVAGSPELVSALLEAPLLEVRSVSADDGLSFDADRVNVER